MIVTCTPQRGNPNGYHEHCGICKYGEKTNEQTQPRAPSMDPHNEFMNMHEKTL
jgi:hypothetical protein